MRLLESEQYYKSSFEPSAKGLSVLRTGKIISEDESPAQMIDRIVIDLASVEVLFNTPEPLIRQFAISLGEQMDSGKIVFSTPIMTNANKAEQRPLSACTIPPVDLRGSLQDVKKMVDIYHQEAMGTGFDLTQVDDPVRVLLFLNNVAAAGAESGREDRPVGNMATCRIDHPKILDFIRSKADRPDVNWKFNISVDIPDSFWYAVENNEVWHLSDGTDIKATELLHEIAVSAHGCADPGIICLDRLNADNPTPNIGLYTSTAPCAEVGLVPGETCQFGYLNLAKFIDKSSNSIDYQKLAESAWLLTRSLDNAMELSISRYTIRESARVMSQKRKIGVGVCGLADMLVHLGIPYGSESARDLCRDVVSFINYQTKVASHNLAKTRGSFAAMNSVLKTRYSENPGFIEQKYGALNTNTVSVNEWKQLGSVIRETQMLRNSSTVSLPPTGRSGLVVSASTGVEPLFTLVSDGEIHPALFEQLKKYGLADQVTISKIYETGSCQNSALPNEIKNIFKTATEINPWEHLKMVSAILPCVDESISKTINLPNEATVAEVESIYMEAHRSGLKGVTIYRNGSVKNQPRKVA